MNDLDLDKAPGQERPILDGARARIHRALKLSPVFDKAARTSKDTALAAASLEILPGDAQLFQQDAPSSGIIVLGRGRARVERAAGDKGFIPLGYRGSGDMLGESCIAGIPHHTENATAMEEVEAVRIPTAVMNSLIAADPALASAVMGLMLSRQREVEERIESMLFRNVEGRLAEFLLKAAERWGVPSPKGTLISAPITHLEIAQSIGSTRETVTLTLGALRREGLLDVAGRRLIVKDREALAARQ
ncbi:MAG: Crp/Fnr family transcriptional regulator [Polyangiaceae bacterium]|nr:Crp/Fnr family transcriptional regulator [Polyangiaceae bacterium]